MYKRIMFMMGAHCTLSILALWYWLELQIGFEIGVIILAWVLLNAVLICKTPARLNKFLAMSGGLLVLYAVAFQLCVLLASGRL